MSCEGLGCKFRELARPRIASNLAVPLGRIELKKPRAEGFQTGRIQPSNFPFQNLNLGHDSSVTSEGPYGKTLGLEDSYSLFLIRLTPG